MDEKTGVLLMTYGSATTAEHVAEYMQHIFKDRIPPGVIEDFENRYRLVGHSPLVEITQKQAELVQESLGTNFVVRSAMRHSVPFIKNAIEECRAAGATRIIGIILSPQFSSFIMEGYKTEFIEAGKAAGFAEENLKIAAPWPTEPHFIELLAKRVSESYTFLYEAYDTPMPVVFTTHSLPERVVKQDPSYLDQLTQTIDAVRTKLPNKLEWYAAYQSAGHTPEEWLKPDLVDILAKLRDNQAKAVLIVPIQFLTDHLEILYDLDIAAKEQCDEFGIAYHRTELPNTDPLFIEALAAITHSNFEM